MQRWIIGNENYLSYLRKTEDRIPNSNYGESHYKPFFGELFSVGDLVYVTQVSSVKPRHEKLKNSKDFFKLYISSGKAGKPDELVAVVNLNYMFPVPYRLIEYLEMKNIDQVRGFGSEEEKTKYINLLNKEIEAINVLRIDTKAQNLYSFVEKYPEAKISQRCFNFKFLEQIALKYSDDR
ncbi:MAG: type III toxin-antitoxin system ToxN/AbiQ family toxin [Synergistes sp.]|nr:type III toxin-antitoxin system ToxN/AbiQ family toxin [Synergistes sp.]